MLCGNSTYGKVPKGDVGSRPGLAGLKYGDMKGPVGPGKVQVSGAMLA